MIYNVIVLFIPNLALEFYFLFYEIATVWYDEIVSTSRKNYFHPCEKIRPLRLTFQITHFLRTMTLFARRLHVRGTLNDCTCRRPLRKSDGFSRSKKIELAFLDTESQKGSMKPAAIVNCLPEVVSCSTRPVFILFATL